MENDPKQIHAKGNAIPGPEVQPIIDAVIEKQKNEEKSSVEVGRPTVMDEITLQKLEMAFKVGCTDAEACFYADISMRTLYYYQEANKEFLHKKELWKKRPVLKARQVVVGALENNDLPTAKWYLEKNWEVEEFGDKLKHSGEIATDFPHIAVFEYRQKLKEAMREDIKKYWESQDDNQNSDGTAKTKG